MFVIRHVSDYSRLQPDHCVVGLAAVSGPYDIWTTYCVYYGVLLYLN